MYRDKKYQKSLEKTLRRKYGGKNPSTNRHTKVTHHKDGGWTEYYRPSNSFDTWSFVYSKTSSLGV